MRNMAKLITIILIVLLLSSCNYQNLLEELGFTQALCFDLIEENNEDKKKKLKISISYPNTNPENEKMSRNFLTATAAISKEGKIMLARQTELKLVSGQLRSILFGLSLAEQGIWEEMDTLLRDSSVSPRVKIVVVNGDASELLGKDYPPHPRTGQYIHRMLNKESISQQIPKVTLFEFSRDYHDDGIDPIAPLLKEHGKGLILDGIALFSNDKYVTNVKPEHATLFNLLRKDIVQGEIVVDLSGKQNGEDSFALFSAISSRKKIKIDPNFVDNQFNINIHLQLKGSIMEYTGDLQLDDVNDQKKITQFIEECIQEEAGKLIANMQKHKADNLGLGKYVRNSLSYKQWKDMEWQEIFPNVKVNFIANVKIRDYGKIIN